MSYFKYVLLLVLILFPISVIYGDGAQNCLDSTDLEIKRYNDLKKYILEQTDGLDESTKSKFFEYSKTDSKFVGYAISKNCLESKGIEMKNIVEVDEKWTETIFPYSDIVLTALSIFGSVYLSFYLRNRHTKNTAKKAINIELSRIEKIFEDRLEVSIKKINYQYVGSIITTVAFDSAVSSGAFSHFSPNDQDALDTLYFHIKQHNLELTDLNRYLEQYQMNGMTAGLALLMRITLEHFGETEGLIQERIKKTLSNF